MNVQVRLFAAARELAGAPVVHVDVPQRVHVGDVRGALLRAYPQLEPLLPSARFAAQGRYVDDQHCLQPGQELALIPPVSGG